MHLKQCRVNRIDDGEWRRESDTVLAIGLNDSNGLEFPDDLTLPANGVEVSWDGAAATILNLTGRETLLDLISSVPVGIRLTFDGTLPAAGTALTLMVPSARDTDGHTGDRRCPCGHSQSLIVGRDFLRVSETDSRHHQVTSTRFVVRAEGPAWATGDIFTDDQGETQTVQGVGEIGRGRWLELLTQG